MPPRHVQLQAMLDAFDQWLALNLLTFVGAARADDVPDDQLDAAAEFHAEKSIEWRTTFYAQACAAVDVLTVH